MRRRRTPAPAEIPTSSMADVAMLLVAFFALTAAFTQTAGLPARFEASEDQLPDESEATAIELRLDADGRAWLLDRPLPQGDWEEPLVAGLAPLLALSPERPVFVSTHREAPLGAFIELQDALARASRRLRVKLSSGASGLRIVVPTLAQEARLRTDQR